jgi:hypothetical protein
MRRLAIAHVAFTGRLSQPPTELAQLIERR